MKNESIKKFTKPKSLIGITTYQAGIMQATANRSLQKQSDRILKEYGITKTQWLIIGTIDDAGGNGIRLTELTNILDTTMSYLTNTINLLESKGILSRVCHESDSRAKMITINENYQTKCNAIEKKLRDGLRESIYSKIDAKEFAIYMKVMSQLGTIDNN